MNHHRRRKSVLILVCILASCFFLATGCANSKKKKSGPTTGPMPVYYDFGDVLVPKELKVIKKESAIFTAPDLSAGVLSLKGRVDRDSLIAFFEDNMSKDNWALVGTVKTPHSMLLFQKETRWCVIEILEKTLDTRVKIWVTTTLESSKSGLLKE